MGMRNSVLVDLKSEYIYEVCSKSKVTFQISRATYFRLSIFLFCYVGTLFPNICTKFQLIPLFCLVVRGVKVTSCFACSAIFCYRKIWIKGFVGFNLVEI